MASKTIQINTKPDSTTTQVKLELNGKQTPITSSTITTTAKSSTTTVTASSKRSRKSDINHNESPGTNFLPIAPHHQYYSHGQGLTLASVQQQLQGGSVAVFTSPTMVQQQGGPQGAPQQLMVAGPGQTIGPNQLSGTFNTGNGQGPQLIQAGPGLGMMSALPQMQVIQQNGQPTYAFQQVYGQMQPMLLNGNLTMAFPTQNQPQGLAIQIPNGQAGGMQINNTTPNTPVKNQQQQHIIKSLTISPQQQPQQATKSNINNSQARQQQQQQQQIIQQAAFQSGAPNQTYVFGTFQGAGPNQANGPTLQMSTTPTNNRKSNSSGRSNSSGNKGSNTIQKIQPATNNLAGTQLLTPTQFKQNTSPYQNQTSPANGQTIMVHGPNMQPGGGQIQIGHNGQQTILSPLTSFSTLPNGLTWASASPMNQQSAQLVTQNGQQIFIRAQGGPGGDHMLIPTSNNQFQVVPMQMAQAAQHQQQNGTMQMTQTGQQIVASPIGQQLPISIQPNQGVAMAPTAIVTQQTNSNSVQSSNLLTSVTVSQSANTPTNQTNNSSRQRLIRPAGTQSSIATQTAAGKQKPPAPDTSRVSTGNVTKLAPKASTANAGTQQNTLPHNQISSKPVKLTLPTPSKPDPVKLAFSSNSTPTTFVATATKSTALPKVSTVSTGTQNMATSTQSISTNSTSVNVTLSTNVQSMNTTSTTTNLVTNPSSVQSTPKLNRKVEKKDASIGIDAKNSPLSTSAAATKTKTSTTPARSNMKTSATSTNSTSTANVATGQVSTNTQMINGVLCQMPAINNNNNNSQVKPTLTNGNGPLNKSTSQHSVGSKPLTSSVASQNQKVASLPKPKPKQPENLVLTHVIDGYIIQESPNPFPINGFLNGNESKENATNEKNSSSQINGDISIKNESKENVVQPNKEQQPQPQQNNVILSGSVKTATPNNNNNDSSANNKNNSSNNTNNNSTVNSQNNNKGVNAATDNPVIKPKPNNNNTLCINCGKNERLQAAKKKKLKKFCSQRCHDLYSFNKQQQPPNGNGVKLQIGNQPNNHPQLVAQHTQQPLPPFPQSQQHYQPPPPQSQQQHHQPPPPQSQQQHHQLQSQQQHHQPQSQQQHHLPPLPQSQQQHHQSLPPQQPHQIVMTNQNSLPGQMFGPIVSNPMQPLINNAGGNVRLIGPSPIAPFTPVQYPLSQAQQQVGLNPSLPPPISVNMNGQMNATAKRPLPNPAVSSVSEKRQRISSPITVKSTESSVPQQANNKSQNGVSEAKDTNSLQLTAKPDTKVDSVSNNSNNSIPELEGLWLPAGGKELSKWSVQDVYDFVFHLDGCSEFAEEFRSQEMDGQALMLIKEDHIIAILNMKLGPALKICRKIKDLKTAFGYS